MVLPSNRLRRALARPSSETSVCLMVARALKRELPKETSADLKPIRTRLRAGAFFTSPECDRNVEPEAVMRRLFANLVMHTPPGSKERER
jgi:hypothetical protein